MGQGFRTGDLSGGWTEGSVAGAIAECRVSKKSRLVKEHLKKVSSRQRASTKSLVSSKSINKESRLTKEHQQRVPSRQKSPVKESRQRASPKSLVSSKSINKESRQRASPKESRQIHQFQ